MSREVYQVYDGDELLLQVPVSVVGHRPIPANAVCTVPDSDMCPVTGHRIYPLHGRVRSEPHPKTLELHYVAQFYLVHDHHTRAVIVDCTQPVLYSKVLNEDGSQRRISADTKIIKTTVDDDSPCDQVYQ
ncbi:hypothetical protein [Tunturiibacter gelidiferens]|uniref:hypothetical protein n=1 Tax=Tunturiibacter gelidiferens TaxID=3069689 RepID=UPI003D9AFF60